MDKHTAGLSRLSHWTSQKCRHSLHDMQLESRLAYSHQRAEIPEPYPTCWYVSLGPDQLKKL